MSYYDQQPWQNASRTWEAPAPPPRTGTSSVVQREDANAFASQLEEVERAMENLMKSGKLFPLHRRDSLPPINSPRGFSADNADFRDGNSRGLPSPADPRMGGAGVPQRHHSLSDYDPSRAPGSNLQNFYASARFQPRAGDADPAQAKRRMAAQRERDLRNYHQEQQFNRNKPGLISTRPGTNDSDRVSSPVAMTEDDRRDLIARQHRALYGNDVPPFTQDGIFDESGRGSQTQPIGSGAPSVASGTRGPSPLAFDPFGFGSQDQPGSAGPRSAQDFMSSSAHAGSVTGPSPIQPQRSRTNSASSPSTKSANFNPFESTGINQQSSRTSASSPGGSPPRSAKHTGPVGSAVAPIGTRPSGSAPNPALKQRSTTPLPSPLSYGFNAGGEDASASRNGERSASATSNPTSTSAESTVGLGWGTKTSTSGSSGGVWGNKNPLGVQASVWG